MANNDDFNPNTYNVPRMPMEEDPYERRLRMLEQGFSNVGQDLEQRERDIEEYEKYKGGLEQEYEKQYKSPMWLETMTDIANDIRRSQIANLGGRFANRGTVLGGIDPGRTEANLKIFESKLAGIADRKKQAKEGMLEKLKSFRDIQTQKGAGALARSKLGLEAATVYGGIEQERYESKYMRERDAKDDAFTERQLTATEEKNRNTAEANRLAGVAERDKELVKRTTDMRKEFNGLPIVKDFVEGQKAVNTIATAVQNPGAMSDVTLVFSFMKALDPRSTVREGEVAMVASAAGIPERIVTYLTKALEGETLSPTQRQEIYDISVKNHESRRAEYDGITGFYTNEANKLGIDPSSVVVPYAHDRGAVTTGTTTTQPTPSSKVDESVEGLKGFFEGLFGD